MLLFGRAAKGLALAWLAAWATSARSDDGPKPDPRAAAEAVDRVLAEWQAKASTITSVEVRFRATDAPKRGDRKTYEGRAILAAPNLALLETSPVAADGKAELERRWIWNGRSILQFEVAERQVTRYPIREEWPEAPGPLRLPFFFRMTVEGAKRDHDWSLIRDDPDQVVLGFRPKGKSGVMNESASGVLVLDRKTFLPMRMVSQVPDDQGTQTFEVVEIKLNAVKDVSALVEPCLDSWEVDDFDPWISRLFLK